MTNDVVETKVDNISENRDSVDNSESSSFVLPRNFVSDSCCSIRK